ncbi:uncharacterized protein BDZ99DRAFT_522613 [Mytilinidion resinicola]|uniref:Uncharacterized protein n=1 Tax=Mytilinidion resinicola TaxID=574789 RepID=A0A6A6YHK9_9PEZI|nr:uncharacterized protein BDZ99DRAFT_522613 [Mytilinidion resinicola]KAF2808013.1 hypothetical protein BDZ99DRAFT_522613 [Mytilinidion resinicola]
MPQGQPQICGATLYSIETVILSSILCLSTYLVIMDFISNIISNSVAGFVDAGTRAAGGFAGDALIKAGDIIENTGRGVGTSVEAAATSYGTKIAGQGAVNSVKGSTPKKAITAGKPAGAQRSYSSPASTSTKKTATPIGANKYPGGKIGGTPIGANKKHPGGKTGPTPIGANKHPGGKIGPTPIGANKYPGGTNKSLPTVKPAATKKPALAGAPKPYPSSSSKPDASKPKPYPGTTTYPSKKPSGGASASKEADKPYPGTSTIPGSGKKTAVKAGKPKPLASSYTPPSKAGDKFSRHLPEIKV